MHRSVKRQLGQLDSAPYVIRSELSPESPNPNEKTSHIYLNLSIINGDTSDTVNRNPPKCFFSEVRSVPILQDASEYDLSVIRFSASGTGRLLPLWIPVIQSNQPLYPVNPNLTIYSVTVRNGITGVSAQRYLQYVPLNKQAPVPTTVNPQDLTSDYYFARTYTQFADMFNLAFKSAYEAANLVVPAETFVGLVYNSTTGLFGLTLTDDFFRPLNSATIVPAQLYFNAPMANLLSSFNLSQVQPSATIPGGVFQVLPPRIPVNASSTETFYQDFISTDDVWSPVDSFCFTTTFLPLIPEQQGVPVVVGSSNIGQNLAVGQAFSNVITDFVPDFSGGAQNAINQVTYIPSGEYRISSMTSHQPIQQIDITMWWRYRLTGEPISLFMSNLSSVSIKILFRRKDWGSQK